MDAYLNDFINYLANLPAIVIGGFQYDKRFDYKKGFWRISRSAMEVLGKPRKYYALVGAKKIYIPFLQNGF